MPDKVFTNEDRLKFAYARKQGHPEQFGPYIHPTVFPDGIPEHVQIGKRPFLGKNVCIGGTGFSFAWDPEKESLVPVAHEGGVIIGDDVTILENSNIHRATMQGTNTVIGDGTKIDTLIHIAHNTRIGKNVIITSGATVAGSCNIHDRVIIWSRAAIGDHVEIAEGVVIGAGAVVIYDILEPWTVWVGNPARKIRDRRKDEYV